MVDIMACRVFRNTIFGRFRETEIATILISRELKADIPLPLLERELGSRTKQEDDPFGTDGIFDTQNDELRECVMP
jgi:hypothetical protein